MTITTLSSSACTLWPTGCARCRPAAPRAARWTLRRSWRRSLAARAGIGWLGKNTCVIHPRIGSWILLGQILTTCRCPPDAAAAGPLRLLHPLHRRLPDGRDHRTVPTRRPQCIAYLTIEHRGPIDESFSRRWANGSLGATSARKFARSTAKRLRRPIPLLQPRFPTGSLSMRRRVELDSRHIPHHTA